MTEQNNSLEQQEISLLFENARINLNKIDDQAKNKKKNIVKDLARDLEGKIPIETICIEIVNQLRSKVSERFIRECLEDRYKQQDKAENAKKQKERHKSKESYESVAAHTPLKQEEKYTENNKEIIIVAAGQGISIKEKEEEVLKLSPTSSNTIESTFDSKVSGQNLVDDVKVCLSCKEALSTQTALVTAEVMSANEREFTIPRDKFQDLSDAMKRSSNIVFIIFYKGGLFERAIPDTFRSK
jgi:actin-related protein